MNKNILIIIPTYNESSNIKKIIDKISQIDSSYHILVVDDNSPDKTYEIVENIKINNPNINLLKRNKKSGLGSAYIAGFKWAIEKNYNVVVQIDADFSHNPKDIPSLVNNLAEHDLIIGSRYIKGISIVNWPLSRLILSYCANLYARIFTVYSIKDITGGFKCFNIDVLRKINLNEVKSEGYSFQIEINYLAWKNNFRINEVPIIFTDRTSGASKMSKKVILEAIFMVPYLGLKNKRKFRISCSPEWVRIALDFITFPRCKESQ